ncbi:MAG: serine/threonine protein kinase [Ardenticatenaceae bacterium]
MQWLKRSKVRWMLLVFIMLVIGSLLFVRFVLYNSLGEAIESGQITVRGTKEGNRGFTQPILQVELTKETLLPLIVEVPQGLTLESDENYADMVIAKSEWVLLWSGSIRPTYLFAYSLHYHRSWPNEASEYQPTEIKADLVPVLENIDALNLLYHPDEAEFASQIAVWRSHHGLKFDKLKERASPSLDIEWEAYDKTVSQILDETQSPLPWWLLIILLLLVVLIGGIVWWRPRKKKLIDYLEDWQELGEGGMAKVWVAVDKRQPPPKKVVVKFPKEVFDPIKKKNIDYRFRREAELHQRLQHENIVPVFNSGWSPSPISINITPCLIQQFIEGDTIKSLLKQQPQKGLPEITIFSIVEQLLDALEYIHGEEIVHRDLTSNNVMVDKSGKVHLIDFGTATEFYSGKTQEQGFPLFGTIPFYAPNLRIPEAAPSRDFYALAVLMITMYGERLPKTEFPEEAHDLLIANLPKYRIPSAVKRVLWACLTGKYREAGKVRQDLRRARIISDRGSDQGRRKKLIDYLEDWQELDQGGMAEVWVAVDKRQQPPKKVVVKFPQERVDPIKKKNIDYRFRMEARLHEGLQHKNVVPVIDSGWSQHPISKKETPCLIQKFIEGDTIKSLLKQPPYKPLPERLFFYIVEQLLDALEYIHREKVVHRDLTLNNVMVDKRGTVHLIDFGIATDIHSEKTKLQGYGLFGTPPFYAPSPQIDDAAPARDFYALAVLMIAMYGETLPKTQYSEEAHDLLIENLPKYRIPSAVKRVLSACLTGKYREAEEVRQDLQEARDRGSDQDGANPDSPPPDTDDDDGDGDGDPTRTA